MSDHPYRGPKHRRDSEVSPREPKRQPPARNERSLEPRATDVAKSHAPRAARSDAQPQRAAARPHKALPMPPDASSPVDTAERVATVRERAGGPRAAGRPESRETRLHGFNACRAAFDARPQDLRKVYLAEARIPALRDVLAWCVKHRLGYRVVEDDDLQKLSASSHHEGVLFEMRERASPTLAQLLHGLPSGPQVLLWLDGVGNPHNFGALLRSAAHFGMPAVLLPPESPLTLSGAACRVAEGGAERVDVVRMPPLDDAVRALRAAGFVLAATLPHGGDSVYAADLPPRLVLVFGAEQAGMQRALIEACDLRLGIPGTGQVESLNIANAVAVMLGECWRRRMS